MTNAPASLQHLLAANGFAYVQRDVPAGVTLDKGRRARLAAGTPAHQSEFATWPQCRALLSDEARPAAFRELVGAVTAYVMTGEKPALRADVPPAELLAVA